MNQKIVKIRKLDDIDKNDWEIHFDNETHIVYKHEELFKIVELGLSREKPVIKKEETDTPIFFPKDEEWENLKKKEKSIVKKFREDELEHHDTGVEHQAEMTTGYVLLSKTIKQLCYTAIKITKKY